MCKSAGVKIVRVTIFYFAEGGGHEKWPKTAFFAKVPSPRHFCEEIFSGVVPSERARTQLSEYVGHIGVLMIKTIVIAAQSQDRAAKVGSSRKIGGVTKK